MNLNDKDPTSPQNRLIAFMERKSELLGAKNILFTPEDAEELLSWPDDQTERVIAKILEKDFFLDSHICPWCIFFEDGCNVCTFAQRHGECEEGKDNTYAKVLEALLGESFVSQLAPHKAELLALLERKGEDQR